MLKIARDSSWKCHYVFQLVSVLHKPLQNIGQYSQQLSLVKNVPFIPYALSKEIKINGKIFMSCLLKLQTFYNVKLMQNQPWISALHCKKITTNHVDLLHSLMLLSLSRKFPMSECSVTFNGLNLNTILLHVT